MALMPVADALAAILDGATPLPEESVALDDALHRILARDLRALRTQPPQAMSAMDGYAVRATDVANVPARLAVIGEIAAGKPFDRVVGPGEAARIFTGGVLPDGADAIVIQEDCTREADNVLVKESSPAGKHVRAAGVDFHEGDTLLSRARLLTDRDLSLAAAMNYPLLPVHRRPKVAVLATGDELVLPGTKPGPGQIVLSNGYALRALIRREGGEPVDLGIAVDTLDAHRDAIRRARANGADILLTTGGASVGDHDLVKTALEAEGVAMAFWRIAMRPGKPMMHGRVGAMRVVGLPGNPVSSYVCAFLFVVPLIRALSGRDDIRHMRESAVLGRDLPANDQREDYLRTKLSIADDGATIATPVDKQDSSLLGNLAVAEGLLIRPPFAEAAAKGSRCEIMRLPR